MVLWDMGWIVLSHSRCTASCRDVRCLDDSYPGKTVSDFDDIIKKRFNLVPVTFDEIDSVPE